MASLSHPASDGVTLQPGGTASYLGVRHTNLFCQYLYGIFLLDGRRGSEISSGVNRLASLSERVRSSYAFYTKVLAPLGPLEHKRSVRNNCDQWLKIMRRFIPFKNWHLM